MTALTLLALVASSTTSTPVDDYAFILDTYVREGLVDYRGIERDALPRLDRFVAHLGRTPLPEQREKRIAWLANAYNAFVIRSVIRHARPRSVLDVEGFFAGEKHLLAGRELTLDALEKELLLPFAKDPRLHFVLVCGAVGCPRLASTPLAAETLESRLERAPREYFATPFGAKLEGEHIYVSRILDWYGSDFGGPSGVRAFLLRYLGEKSRTVLRKFPHRVAYIDYNWSLNQQ